MPELPEVETVRRVLQKNIVGHKIESITLLYDKLIKEIEPDDFTNKLVGKMILDVKRYAKFLLFEFDDFFVVSHLRMEGKYFLKDPLLPIEKHEHIIFHLDGFDMRYHDTRKFGIFLIRDKKDLFNIPPLSEIGIEGIDENLDINYLKPRLNKKIPIKSLLLDQSIISGIGNIYADEILFVSNINPKTFGSMLTDLDLENIIKNTNRILKEAINQGGTTIRSYTSSLGVTGMFQQNLNVHTKEGLPCPICHTIIEKTRVGGRGTYFCPNCQKN